MEHYYNIALTVLFSQNLLLVLTFSFGTDPKTFLRPAHACSTGLAFTLVLVILAPLSRFLCILLSQVGLSYFSLLVQSLLATWGTFGLCALIEKIFPDLWLWAESSLLALPSNAGILGVLLLCEQYRYTCLEAFVFALFGGIGVLVALLSLVGIRQNQEHHHTPECFRGLPLLFITAGLMSLSFVGFYGLNVQMP